MKCVYFLLIKYLIVLRVWEMFSATFQTVHWLEIPVVLWYEYLVRSNLPVLQLEKARGCQDFLLISDIPQLCQRTPLVSSQIELNAKMAQRLVECVRLAAEEKVSAHCPCSVYFNFGWTGLLKWWFWSPFGLHTESDNKGCNIREHLPRWYNVYRHL